MVCGFETIVTFLIITENKVDYNGKWDVYIHLMKDRSVSGLGNAVVKDMNGSEVFRFAINYDLRKIQGIYYKR